MDRRVRFAGYRKPHPLFDLLELKVQSNGEVKPHELVKESCENLDFHISAIERSFEDALAQFN